jgi:hypothetical protein
MDTRNSLIRKSIRIDTINSGQFTIHDQFSTITTVSLIKSILSSALPFAVIFTLISSLLLWFPAKSEAFGSQDDPDLALLIRTFEQDESVLNRLSVFPVLSPAHLIVLKVGSE